MNPGECDVVIGEVTGAYGTRGEVKVRPEPDSIERFRGLSEVCVRHDEREWIGHVARARRHGREIILSLTEVDTVPRARLLRGALLAIPRAQRRELPPGEYFVDDLIGLDVVTPDGRQLGKVEDVLQLPANDVYVVGAYLYPAIREYVLEIDVPGGRIVVRPPEEVFEE
ncbi:MAG: 16S rRNA processing protein RimM [Armatimonadetes bacterium]|nr:16S rRNA processing protein RimM [Armatimonadota bacterium]